MKRVLFSMVLLLVASFTFAQEKNVKEAKSIANGVNPDFAKAEELINQALTNPETKDNAETWDVAGLIQRKRSEKEMENAYLRKPYDTLQVYNSALNMCKFYFKCDELAQIPNEKGKIKNKYRKSNSATILAERGNLIMAASNSLIWPHKKKAMQPRKTIKKRWISLQPTLILLSTRCLKRKICYKQILYYLK